MPLRPDDPHNYGEAPADPNDRDTWTTRLWVYRIVHQIFRPLLDPCCFAKTAKCRFYYTADEDGLAQPWFGRVFANPPFGRGRIDQWVAKFLHECLENSVLVVALIPLNVDSNWWKRYVAHPHVDIISFPGRVSFGGCKSSPPFRTCLAIYWPPWVLDGNPPITERWQMRLLHTYTRYKSFTAGWQKQELLGMPADVVKESKDWERRQKAA